MISFSNWSENNLFLHLTEEEKAHFIRIKQVSVSIDYEHSEWVENRKGVRRHTSHRQ